MISANEEEEEYIFVYTFCSPSVKNKGYQPITILGPSSTFRDLITGLSF